MPTPSRRLAAEAVGTLFLLAAIVGSGIMGERLAGGNVAIALLANAVSTGAMLVVLILTMGPVSGAQLNPAVTVAAAWRRGVPWSEVPYVLGAQALGAFCGVALAHAMFGETLLSQSAHARAGVAQIVSEFVATFGLLMTIWGTVYHSPRAVPFAVGAYITSACWFTASTSFANPAVTLARAFTGTFAGIRLVDVPWFVVAQVAGAAAATMFMAWLVPAASTDAPHVSSCPESRSPAPRARRRGSPGADASDGLHRSGCLRRS